MRIKSDRSPGKGGGGRAARDDHENAVYVAASIVEEITRDPRADIFLRSVNSHRKQRFGHGVADDFEIIAGPPMDLAMVMRKFRNGDYATAQQMREDVVQIWRNCKDINGDDNPIYERARALSDFFDERFEGQITPPFHDTTCNVQSSVGEWIGRRVKVYWKGDHAWYTGFINKVHRIKVCACSAERANSTNLCAQTSFFCRFALCIKYTFATLTGVDVQGGYILYDDGEEEW